MWNWNGGDVRGGVGRVCGVVARVKLWRLRRIEKRGWAVGSGQEGVASGWMRRKEGEEVGLGEVERGKGRMMTRERIWGTANLVGRVLGGLGSAKRNEGTGMVRVECGGEIGVEFCGAVSGRRWSSGLHCLSR